MSVNLRYIIFGEFPESILALHLVFVVPELSLAAQVLFLMFLGISVLVCHLQFFDEPATATTFPV